MFCTFKCSGSVVIFVQSDTADVIFVFFHRPPLTPPAITVLPDKSVGSKIIALVRPPMLFGPLSIQLLSVPSPGTLPLTRASFLVFSNSSLINVKFSGVGLPIEGFMDNNHSCSKYLLGGNPADALSSSDKVLYLLILLCAK